MNLENISRIEIIGEGREYVKRDTLISDILIQDKGKTMKIILRP